MPSGRIKVEEVRQIVETSAEDEVITNNFIDTAATIVNENLLNMGHTPDALAKIELYLTAHLIALTEERGGLVRSSVGDTAETYSDAYMSGGLDLTRFGQMAKVLDTSGMLASIGSPKLKASFRVV